MQSIATWERNISSEVIGGVDPNHLTLIIFPTEQCNFRCIYCYEDFSIGEMSSTTVDAIIKLLTERSSDMRSLSVGWFGGEPLLAKQVIFEVCEHITSLRQQVEDPFNFDGFITTNGFLLDKEMLDDLAKYGITRFQITLDGPREIHNRSRYLCNGAGTFDRIWQNLICIRESHLQVSVLLRLHFNTSTAEDLPQLIHEVNTTFGSDPRFKAFAHAIENLGGEGSGEFCDYETSYDTKLSLDNMLCDSLRIDSTFENNYVCYASKPNSFCLRSNGTVAKCTVALRDPLNSIGTLLSDGRLQLNHDLHALWIRGATTLDQRQLRCPYGTICNLTIAPSTIL